jgi:hypothetical protein
MKNMRIVCVASVLMLGVAFVASAGERSVSKSKLGKMGFASMRVMSNNDGLAVRGKGTTATVWGSSTSQVGGNTGTTGYYANSSHYYGSSLAAGASISVSGQYSSGWFGGLTVGGTAGGSIAYAK